MATDYANLGILGNLLQTKPLFMVPCCAITNIG